MAFNVYAKTNPDIWRTFTPHFLSDCGLTADPSEQLHWGTWSKKCLLAVGTHHKDIVLDFLIDAPICVMFYSDSFRQR